MRCDTGDRMSPSQAGVLERDTNRVSSAPIKDTTQKSIRAFITERVSPQAKLYTDQHAGYNDLPGRQFINHQRRQYVDGPVHTNGIES